MRIIKSSNYYASSKIYVSAYFLTHQFPEKSLEKNVIVGKEKEQDPTEIGCLHSKLIHLARSKIPPPFPAPLTLTREEEMGSCTYISLSSQISHRKLIACCAERN